MAARNGHSGNGVHQPGGTRKQLGQLKLEAQTIETKLQIGYLRNLETQLKESSAQWVSPWVAWSSDRLKQFQTQPDRFLSVGRNDRLRGRNAPMFQNEQDLAIHRGLSRIMCATNNYAIGLVEGLTSFVVGDGMSYRAASVDDKDPAPDALLNALQSIVDEVQEINSWQGGEQPGLEEELFQRSIEDGEFFVTAFIDPEQGWTHWRTVEPEHVICPPGHSGDPDWMFGVHNVPGDVQQHDRYFYQTGENTTEGREIGADAMVHYRRNTKRSIKRGFPDFSFDAFDSLDSASKLRKAIALGAALQASIAGIRQHENATKAQVQNFASALEDWSRTNPITGNAESVHRREPGTFLDIPKGLEYIPPPGYANANDFIGILQAIVRGAGQRWNAPEWMSAASVNETVYASALVVDSMFSRTVRRNQARYTETFRRMHWSAVRNRVRALGDRLRVVSRKGDQVETLEFTWDDIKRLCHLQVEPDKVESQDPQKQAQNDQVYVQMKVKSPQTICQEMGLDWDVESANIQQFEETFGQQGQPLPLPGDAGTPQAPAAAGGDAGDPLADLLGDTNAAPAAE